MQISIFGLGYVGCVTAGCLAKEGHHVIGVDVNETKVNMINQGHSPIVEPGLDDLIRTTVQTGRLSATIEAEAAVGSTGLSIICVGTPGNGNGSLDLKYVRNVTQQMGEAMAKKNSKHLVVVRSTLLPGTTHEFIIPALEAASEKPFGEGFDLCVNPEFLREGSAIADFYHPPKIVIGADHKEVAELVATLYDSIEAPCFLISIEVAEMTKYADNAFHALKVAFANEIGNFCQQVGIDSHKVMEIFCQDTKLNLSPCYLKPGFAFGGSCLPKDVRALVHRARMLDLNLPVLEAILPSNELQIRHAIDLIANAGKKRIGILGFSFKAGTDDLRNSPVVEVIETLLGKGYTLRIFDESVSLAKLCGANKNFIEREIPHVASLMCQSLDEVLEVSDVLVIGTKSPLFAGICNRLRSDQIVIDLVRITNSYGVNDNGHGTNGNGHGNGNEGRYYGLCW